MSTVDQAIYTSQPGYVDQLATFSADVNQVNIFLIYFFVGFSCNLYKVNANSNIINLVSG